MATTELLNLYPLDTSDSSSQPSSGVITQALRILRPHLPTSIALYRRLQFGRFFPASTLLTNLSLTNDADVDAVRDPGPWLFAFVDRSCRPETEVWLSCSWEAPSVPHQRSAASSSSSTTNGNDATAPIHLLLRRLIHTLRTLPLPTSIHSPASSTTTGPILADPGADFSGLSRSDYAAHAANTAILLFGSVHARTTAHLQALDALNPAYAQGLVANHHFVFDVAAWAHDSGDVQGGSGREGRDLPVGLRWGEVRPRDFGLVRARTQIPRQERTLAVLPSVAIFAEGEEKAVEGEGQPVGWAFVGLDGSLTTLHVEPEYRGKGLAKAMTRKLFREKMRRFWEEGDRKWAHGIVIVGNVPSTMMCRSLGGEVLFDCYWLRVDLDRT
nr:hypothetical protein CFP56_22133 [Quercus suber]